MSAWLISRPNSAGRRGTLGVVDDETVHQRRQGVNESDNEQDRATAVDRRTVYRSRVAWRAERRRRRRESVVLLLRCRSQCESLLTAPAEDSLAATSPGLVECWKRHCCVAPVSCGRYCHLAASLCVGLDDDSALLLAGRSGLVWSCCPKQRVRIWHKQRNVINHSINHTLDVTVLRFVHEHER